MSIATGITLASKTRWVLLIFGVIAIFGALAIGIIDGAVIYYKEGDIRPLADATVGKALASDANIGKTTKRLVEVKQQEEAGGVVDVQFVTYLRQQIFTNIVILFFMLWLLFKAFDGLMSLGLSEEQKNFWVKFLSGVISVLVLFLVSALYNGIAYSDWTFPFKGVVELVKNIDVISDSFGVFQETSLSSVETVNQSINASA